MIPEVFENIIFPEKNIQEYQVFQTKEGAEVWLILSGQVNLQKIEEAITTAFQELGFKNSQIKVTQVAHLKHHPETGKLKRFVTIS